mgnify:CR=1 FL=1
MLRLCIQPKAQMQEIKTEITIFITITLYEYHYINHKTKNDSPTPTIEKNTIFDGNISKRYPTHENTGRKQLEDIT